jgi:hypothetical protein
MSTSCRGYLFDFGARTSKSRLRLGVLRTCWNHVLYCITRYMMTEWEQRNKICRRRNYSCFFGKCNSINIFVRCHIFAIVLWALKPLLCLVCFMGIFLRPTPVPEFPLGVFTGILLETSWTERCLAGLGSSRRFKRCTSLTPPPPSSVP